MSYESLDPPISSSILSYPNLFPSIHSHSLPSALLPSPRGLSSRLVSSHLLSSPLLSARPLKCVFSGRPPKPATAPGGAVAGLLGKGSEEPASAPISVQADEAFRKATGSGAASGPYLSSSFLLFPLLSLTFPCFPFPRPTSPMKRLHLD